MSTDKKVDEFLKSMGMADKEKAPEATPQPGGEVDNPWDKIIQPKASYLILGDVGTGKSALAYWLLERYGQKYNLTPAVVGIPHNKASLLPDSFKKLEGPDDLTKEENVIAYVDEADIQLAIEDTKARKYVTNFLSLPRQRHQIIILTFHYPRLVLARYLPFFAAFFHKRPPYLIEFASKSKGDSLYQMMMKAEERFAELIPPGFEPTEERPQPLEVIRNTYVVAPRIRWQGLITNPTASFWNQELSEVWAGTQVEGKSSQVSAVTKPHGQLIAIDGKTLITDEMRARKVKLEDINNPDGNQAVYLDPFSNAQWIE
jgi:hypothetical protein